MADCTTGTGAFIGMTVTTGWNCLTSGAAVTGAQALTRVHDAAVTVSSMLVVRSMTNWTVSQDVFDAPRLEDGCGSFRRKRFGCDRDHSSWSAVVEFNGEFNMALLVGAEGTIRRTSPDGSYWQGTGRIIEADVIPNQSAGEESTANVTFQWQGGTSGGGATHDPTFTAA